VPLIEKELQEWLSPSTIYNISAFDINRDLCTKTPKTRCDIMKANNTLT
jgi:hypothetical protein